MNPAFAWLLAQHSVDLWLLDEHTDPELLQALPPSAQVLTNRYHIHRAAIARGLKAQFSDWALAPTQPPAEGIALAVGKEKLVQHHLLTACAGQWLATGGTLFLVGAKSEGIKSLHRWALTLGFAGALRKVGNVYGAALQHPAPLPERAPISATDYHELRPLRALDPRAGPPLLTKPGLYGWDKIDAGSALLLTALDQVRDGLPAGRVLDLGCGYGYLIAATAHWPHTERTATDTCAAALLAAAANARELGFELTVAPGDCGDTLSGAFDLILCNPPFHAGFAQDFSLTDRFLAAAARLLATGGTALVVVNAFVPVPARAAPLFKRCEVLASDGRYRVYSLKQ